MREKKFDFVSVKGGIDRASTVLKVYPGAALSLYNFEARLGGGHSRISGYERVDGRAAPSAAVYYTVGVADAAGISVGDTLTGGSSGATSKVVIKSGNTLGVTVLSGNYTLNESANGTTITAVESESGQADNDTDDTWQLAAEDYYRDLIGAVPGSGSVLGAVQYKDTKYAFRYDGSSGVDMYKSSASGWTQVTFYHYIFFDGGTLADGDIAAGTTITGATSSATGTVKKFIKNSGSYGVDASGYMVVDVASGTFQDNENIQAGGVTKCVADGANVAISLSNGGKFRFDQYNFYGSADTKYLYGCDGINFAWEFDGTTLCPIFYPAPTKHPSWNIPKYIRAHKHHLFLTYVTGDAAHSSIGEPLVFSALMGASQWGLGDIPTGLAERAGDVMAVYTKDKTYGLYGTSSADWNLQIISDTAGAIDDTVQEVGTFYALDQRGIVPIDRVDAYGDFESATVSRAVKPILDNKASTASLSSVVVGAVPVRGKNQYRLFFTDGTGLIMTDDKDVNLVLPQFSAIEFPDAPTCLSNFEDDSGNEVILFGDSSGYVYQMEKGYNFDGDNIEFAYRTPYMHQGSPHIDKTYRKLFVDVNAERSFTMSIDFALSFGNEYKVDNDPQSGSWAGAGGLYDVGNYDEVYFDGSDFSSVGIELAGTGNNISILFYGDSNVIRPFNIETMEIHYFARKPKRGR